MRSTILHLVGTALLLLAPSVLAAPPLISVEDFSRGPVVAGVQISPDGQRMALLRTVDGRTAITLADKMGGNDTLRYRDPERSLSNVAWSGTGRWLYFFQDAGGDEGYHLFVLDPNSDAAPRDLTPFKAATAELIRSARKDDTLLIALNRRNQAYPDVFKVDLASATLTEVVRNPDRFIEFFAGTDGNIIAASAIEADGAMTLHGRRGEHWQEIYRAPPTERMKVLGADERLGHLIIRSNRGRDQEELLSLNVSSGRTTAIGKHLCGRFDVEDVVEGKRGRLGVVCYQEAATLFSDHPTVSQALHATRKMLGEGAGLWWESASDDLSTIVFFTNEGSDPGRYLIWRPEEGAKLLASARPWLDPKQLVPTQARWITARDGLLLLTYITRPQRRMGRSPTVIAIHGGPWSRDLGGFESETQLLANRGYTVVQVNFRGSTGLGRRVFDAGVKEFGRKMSDDIDDVATALVREGVVDRERICLLGGSYGGYATLMGLARNTVRYRCGVDYAGPVDLATLIKAFPPSWKPYLPRSWCRFVGNPELPDQKADMDAHSPLQLAGRIQSPLLLFQGANDPRVRQEQSDLIACSLRSRGIEVDYLLASNEGHSFANEETRLAVNLSMEMFLAKHLGGRVQQVVQPSTQKARADLLAAGRSNAKCPEPTGASGT